MSKATPKVVLNRTILLHDHFEGCIEIANPEGSFFHPKGRSPEGWKMNPRDWQFQFIPRNDRAIVFLHSLLNKHTLGKLSNYLRFFNFLQYFIKTCRNFVKLFDFAQKSAWFWKIPSIWRNFVKVALVFLPRDVALIFGN